MRIPVAVLLAASLFGCAEKPKPAPVAAFVPPPPAAPTDRAPICARPAEVAAFETTKLKSQLMVAATSCHGEDKYNAFVTRYRPELVASNKTLAGYFSRSGGRRGQQQFDDFITQLAN